MTGPLNNWGLVWAEYFGAALIQNTVFLGLIFLVLYVLKNRSARLRYAVGLIGLFKLLLPPFVPTGILASSPVESITLPLAALDSIFLPGLSLPDVGSNAAGGLNIYGLVLLFWAVFAAVYLASALYATVRLRLILRNAIGLPELAKAHHRGRRPVKLFRSDAIVMPLTLGIFSNRIYVPAVWDQWSEQCRETVLRHEAAHIYRYDGFFQGLQILALAFYFFHPMVWLLNRRLNDYREMACDDASVTGEQFSRIEYSKNLVEIAETIARDTGLCETASALLRRKKELSNRVKYQMKEEVMRSISKRKGFILAAILSLLTIAFSWYPGGAARVDSSTELAMAKSKSSGTRHYVMVSIKDDQNVSVEGKVVSLDKFGNTISISAGNLDGDIIVDLKCDDNTPMGTLILVHQALKKMNLLKVRYQSELGEALPLVLPSKKVEKMTRNVKETDLLNFVITGSGRVELEGKTVPMERIDNLVEKSLSANDHLIVSIRFDEKANYGDFVRVLEQAKNGGAPRIIIGGTGQ